VAPHVESPAEEVVRLRRCLNDIASIMALPAGGEPKRIIDTLMEALLGMLPVAFVYVRLTDIDGGPSIEMMRVAEARQPAIEFQQVRATLKAAFGEAPVKWPPTARVPIGGEDLSVASAQLGLDGELGIVVAGSERLAFPEQTDRVLLEVAAKQAVLGLLQVRLPREKKRTSRELETGAALRSELAVANEHLNVSERELRLIVDNLPGLVALMSPNGNFDTGNRPLLEYFGQTADELRAWRTNDTVHPEDLPHLQEVFSGSSRAGSAFETIQRCKRSDGIYRWFQARGTPLRDTGGEITCWCVLITDIDDQKRAEEALREREYESRLIVDSIPGLITVLAPSGDFERVSLPALEYFGKQLEDLIFWATNDTIHAEDREHVVEAVRASLTSGDPADFEARLRRFDGAYRWFHIRGLPLRDRQGRIVRWYFLNTDIDERKKVEEALKGSERDLKLIIDTIPTQLWWTHQDGLTHFHNQRYLDYIGLSEEQLQGWGWVSTIHPDDVDQVASNWQRIVDSGNLGEGELRWRGHDGTYRWFLYRVSPLRDENGNVVKWYGILIDIDDRKRAEEELRRKEELMTKAQRFSLSGSFSWCVDTNEVAFSEGARRIYEFDLESPVTLERIAGLLHPDDRPVLAEKIGGARGSGGDQDYGIRLQMPDGSIKYLRASSQETRDLSGRREYIGAIQDVTARHQAEEALDKARSELAHVTRVTSLSALTASIAHEINQPLAGIITNAGTCLRMLDANPPNVDGGRETARRTIRDGNRVSDVITRLRALFTKREFTLEPTDLNDAAREVMALSMSDLQRSQVSVQSEFADDVPLVTGDRIQLQQVILNLVRNASDAMSDVRDRPRRLLIGTKFEITGHVRLSVQDSGIGLDGQNMDKLFDSFFTTKTGGMGIGLSVSRSIIERHHGRLWAENNDGPGATFAFSIPARPEGLPLGNSSSRNR
jgi:PAS domain S-box-containing protein